MARFPVVRASVGVTTEDSDPACTPHFLPTSLRMASHSWASASGGIAGDLPCVGAGAGAGSLRAAGTAAGRRVVGPGDADEGEGVRRGAVGVEKPAADQVGRAVVGADLAGDGLVPGPCDALLQVGAG